MYVHVYGEYLNINILRFIRACMYEHPPDVLS